MENALIEYIHKCQMFYIFWINFISSLWKRNPLKITCLRRRWVIAKAHTSTNISKLADQFYISLTLENPSFFGRFTNLKIFEFRSQKPQDQNNNPYLKKFFPKKKIQKNKIATVIRFSGPKKGARFILPWNSSLKLLKAEIFWFF